MATMYQIAPTIVRVASAHEFDATMRGKAVPFSLVQLIRESQMRGSTVRWNGDHSMAVVTVRYASGSVRKVYQLDRATVEQVKLAKAVAQYWCLALLAYRLQPAAVVVSAPVAECPTVPVLTKRGRGRPKGSKNAK